MPDDWDKRQHALEVGKAYRVLRQARSFPDQGNFEVGEVVRVNHIGYSRYDEAHVFTFEAADGRTKAFLLGSDEPLEKLTGTFGGL